MVEKRKQARKQTKQKQKEAMFCFPWVSCLLSVKGLGLAMFNLQLWEEGAVLPGAFLSLTGTVGGNWEPWSEEMTIFPWPLEHVLRTVSWNFPQVL